MSEPETRETPYVETEVLLAVMNESHARALTLIGEMLPGELGRFSRQLQFTLNLVHAVMDRVVRGD